METINILKAILLLIEILPYSKQSKIEIMEQLNSWIEFEETYNNKK